MRLALKATAAAAVLMAGLAPAGVASAATATSSSARPLATNDKIALEGVSATSSSDAWAVGNGPAVLHWDGISWSSVKISGQSGFEDGLSAVDALSPSDAWAVGQQVGVPSQLTTTLIVHWNGTSWQQVTVSPTFDLAGVASFSPTDATAVGGIQTGTHTFTPTVFHWNGTSWARTATLHAPSGVTASGVGVDELSADSPTDMWAIGAYAYTSGATHDRNLAWHWNGTRWAVMNVPSPGITSSGTSGLVAVAAVSPASVWAVGFTQAAHAQKTVSVSWNGAGWTRTATPDPSRQNVVLTSVAAAGSGNIWAVGYYNTGPQESMPHTLILHWNGTSWIRS